MQLGAGQLHHPLACRGAAMSATTGGWENLGEKRYGCFYKLGALFVGDLTIRAVLYGVYRKLPDMALKEPTGSGLETGLGPY